MRQRLVGTKTQPRLRFDTVGKLVVRTVGNEHKLRALGDGNRPIRSLDLFDGDRFDDNVIERAVATIGGNQTELVDNLA